MKKHLIPLLICLSILCGCFAPAQPTLPADGNCNIDTDPLPISQEDLFTLLFDIRNKIQLQLDMEPAELEKMQQDYEAYDQHGSKSPIYRKGNLTVTITSPDGNCCSFQINEVGVRMKGNTSRTSFYSPDEGIYNIIHLKISFQETFDDISYYGDEARKWDAEERSFRKNRTFATLEKLDLRWNRCDDGTYLKEYYAYETYRRNGVLAPYTNLASFDWAGTHMGVFTINEPVDQVFLSKRLPKKALDGDLYKCGWTGSGYASFTSTDSIGIENEDEREFFAYDLKTNKKTSTHESLLTFITSLNSDSVTKEDLAKLVDMDSFLPFAAVSYLLGNPDDMRNNYNNFYLYFRSDNGKAVFIPYDYDRCLGITTHWNPTHTGVTDDSPFSTELLAIDRNDHHKDRQQENPVILYTVAAGGYYVREYAKLLSDIAASDWFSYECFANLYGTVYAHYAADATPGKKFRNTGGLHLAFDLERTSPFHSNGNISIRKYLDAKKTTLQSCLKDTDKYASMPPQIPPTWYIRGDFNDWSDHEDYVMTKGANGYTYVITSNSKMSLKVYNTKRNDWYGSECVSEDCTVEFKTNNHTNIILDRGTYQITFDPDTEVIYLDKLS